MQIEYPFELAQRDETFIFTFEEPEINFTIDEAIVISGERYDVYDGEYVVTPKAHNETILETREKLMADDVTVLKIPYYETSNESGLTVYIAGEDDLIIGGN